jgi:hypothetical protein
MGYTTEFRGEFTLDRPLSPVLLAYMASFARIRHVKRDPAKLSDGHYYGEECEFFCFQDYETHGQKIDGSITDHNTPPSNQPGLWCQWIPNEHGTAIVWDEGEKFYEYIEWLQYIIDKILIPDGYVLNGCVEYRGEEWSDHGEITVIDNVIRQE